MLTFDERGLLPPGDYPMTFDALRGSVLVEGPPLRCPLPDQGEGRGGSRLLRADQAGRFSGAGQPIRPRTPADRHSYRQRAESKGSCGTPGRFRSPSFSG